MKLLDLLASLVIEDGRTWGDAATRVQLEDARAVLDRLALPLAHCSHATARSRMRIRDRAEQS